jgi:hypothetical protein
MIVIITSLLIDRVETPVRIKYTYDIRPALCIIVDSGYWPKIAASFEEVGSQSL